MISAQVACEKPPIRSLDSAQSAVQKARRAGAARYSPEELKQAEESLRQVERAVAKESGRFPFRRDYRTTGALIEQVRFLAVRALRLTQDRESKARRDAAAQIEDLRGSLARAQGIKRYLAPTDRSLAASLVGASVDLEVAEKRVREKDFPGALASAGSGLGRVREAEQLLLSAMVRYSSHPDLPSWRNWVDQALKSSRGRQAVALVVDKLRRRLTVYRGGKKTAIYPVDLGSGGMERKLRAGDDATPEGFYRIDVIRGPGQTRYYRAFLLDYPNAQDRRRFEQARRRGEIPRGADPGGLIEIHGEGGRALDWTKGCVALRNEEMDDLAQVVKVGTPVAIVGYDPRSGEDP
jgi:L,D-transpeptidase catalytic domain/Domain of unknown function (DUF4398)